VIAAVRPGEVSTNILVVFIGDKSAWLLHERFAEEFLADAAERQFTPGCWCIRGSEIKAWLVIQAAQMGLYQAVRVFA